MDQDQRPTDDEIWDALIPGGRDVPDKDMERLFELYKLMVGTSEALVSRRQGVNTFFLTINGALLTGIGLVLQGGGDSRLVAGGIFILAVAGGILSIAWRSLLVSFGQLNSGKFAVINRLEKVLPAAIFGAEWKALGEGENPKIYRSFTSREVWAPQAVSCVYLIAASLCLLVFTGMWTP